MSGPTNFRQRSSFFWIACEPRRGGTRKRMGQSTSEPETYNRECVVRPYAQGRYDCIPLRGGLPTLPTPELLAASRRACRECGCDALDERGQDIAGQIGDVEIEILETPAETLHGVIAKMRIAWYAGLSLKAKALIDFNADLGPLDDKNMMVHIVRDLERLARGATS